MFFDVWRWLHSLGNHPLLRSTERWITAVTGTRPMILLVCFLTSSPLQCFMVSVHSIHPHHFYPHTPSVHNELLHAPGGRGFVDLWTSVSPLSKGSSPQGHSGLVQPSTGPSTGVAGVHPLKGYKTILCRNWEEKGSCRYGSIC